MKDMGKKHRLALIEPERQANTGQGASMSLVLLIFAGITVMRFAPFSCP